LAKDLNYLTSNSELWSQAEAVGRLLNGLLASTERRK